MEELTEVITAAQFHPLNCSEFIYSSSKGTIRLCDMREKALCDQHAKRESLTISGNFSLWFRIFLLFPSCSCTNSLSLSLFISFCSVFEEPDDPSSRSFFTEIIASISDAKFSRNGRYILSRDYLTGKVKTQGFRIILYMYVLIVLTTF